MEVKKETMVNKVFYHRVASTKESIDNYLRNEVELEALMNGCELDWSTQVFDEVDMSRNLKCGDNLKVSLSVTCI